jgi:methionyl-tRNA synthetase
VNRYFDGERPAPRAEDASPLGAVWPEILRRYRERIDGYRLHDALAELWEFVSASNRLVDAEQPWTLAKAAKTGDEEAAERRCGVLGDLVEACRLVGLAVAPFMPRIAPRVLEQVGHAYDYDDDGNGGPPLLDRLAWGALAAEAGRVSPTPAPLFPRLETEAAAAAADSAAPAG